MSISQYFGNIVSNIDIVSKSKTWCRSITLVDFILYADCFCLWL